jgi:hypothetical protein
MCALVTSNLHRTRSNDAATAVASEDDDQEEIPIAVTVPLARTVVVWGGLLTAPGENRPETIVVLSNA